jgi:glycosyltransferase involved in cell wall biosynthesis
MEDKIKLLGSVGNLHEILPTYDCFVFPSHSEGFSGSVVESMMSGVAVLASDISVNKEVVTHEYNGYLFKSGSVEDMYVAMKWFLENRDIAESCATVAVGFSRENFGLNHIAKKLENYLIEKISSS